ncbi:hypothetical protein ACFFJY_17255 [Fictibacillus aquaticus]|uniref:Uncharacterized protein n=1 Tax=Fictibacillus aquaticus TaxID=2021314 RepID=A0A235F5X9_9BACL|nr:hypothetical protein [Fictibacillus aquaticus]OYD56706.1 hypothetical protein CGZ90_17000 [Fictibacillus aquaticus]
MIEFIRGAIVIIMAAIVYAVYGSIKRKKARDIASKVPIPDHLGVNASLQLEKSVMALKMALTEDYQSKIKKRYFAEHPKTNEDSYNHYFFELQRFFLMCSLAKNVPMFSEKADEIWHEMIMFTKDYETFCQQFCGQHIHHTPNDTFKPDPSGRAWFDLLYTELFHHTAYSEFVWGRFFKSPLSKETIEDFLKCSHADLKEKYFRKNADKQLVQEIIDSLKRKIKVNVHKTKQNYTPKRVVEEVGNAPLIAEAMIFTSYKHHHDYSNQMKAVYGQQPVTYSSKNKSTDSSSSCYSSCTSDSCCSSGCGGGD